MTHKNRKKSRIFMFLSTGCSLLKVKRFGGRMPLFLFIFYFLYHTYIHSITIHSSIAIRWSLSPYPHRLCAQWGDFPVGPSRESNSGLPYSKPTRCQLSQLRAEGFSCSLGVLYGGLGISKLQFLIKKIEMKFPAINFIHQTLDPDPGSGSAIRKNAGSGSVSGSALNQCGSDTLNRVPVRYKLS